MQFIQSHEMCAAAAVQVSGIGLQGGWAIRGQTGLKQSLHVACNTEPHVSHNYTPIIQAKPFGRPAERYLLHVTSNFCVR